MDVNTGNNFEHRQDLSNGPAKGIFLKRLTVFFFISLLFHLLFIKIILDRYFDPGTAAVDPKPVPLSIIINQEKPVTTAELEKAPEPVLLEHEVPAQEDRTEQIEEQITALENVEVPASPEENVKRVEQEKNKLPGVQELIEQSHDYARQVAKGIEAQFQGNVYITGKNREKMETGIRMQAGRGGGVHKGGMSFLAYNDQMGDRVYEIGNSCYKIPVVFLWDSMREINSIIPARVLGGCGNGEDTAPELFKDIKTR